MSYNTPRIAVILPVYNGAAYLKLAIGSVINQTLSSFEFLICDDCSTDNSLSIIKEIATENPGRVTIIENKKNLGLFKTLNLLLSETEATYVHLWAQDDIMKPICLERVLSFHVAHPEISMSYHQVNYVNEKNEYDSTAIIDGTPQLISAALYAKISAYWGCMPGNIANVTLNREALEACGGFDETYKVSGDFELWTRLVNYKPIGYIKEPLIYLRRHEHQLSRKHSSVYFSMLEDIPIQKSLIEMTSPESSVRVLNAWKWKTQVKYLNETLFLLSKGEYDLAKQCLKLLRSEFNIFTVTIRWVLIRIVKTFGLTKWFYTTILNTL